MIQHVFIDFPQILVVSGILDRVMSEVKPFPLVYRLAQPVGEVMAVQRPLLSRRVLDLLPDQRPQVHEVDLLLVPKEPQNVSGFDEAILVVIQVEESLPDGHPQLRELLLDGPVQLEQPL